MSLSPPGSRSFLGGPDPIPRPQQGDNHDTWLSQTNAEMEILFRISAVPLMVLGFWTFILSLGGNYYIVRCALFGGLGTLAGLLFFLWGFTNLMTALTMPKVWLLLRRGGDDPWFSSLPEPFNTDPLSVRYQELYREKLSQENARLLEPLVPPRNSGTDFTKSINDPDII